MIEYSVKIPYMARAEYLLLLATSRMFPYHEQSYSQPLEASQQQTALR